MSRILLISPDRVLGQTIAMFLFPKHDVDMDANPDDETFKGYSLLVVDGYPDEVSAASNPALVHLIENSRHPTLWIEGRGAACPVKRKNLLSVAQPLRKDSFQKALDTLLFLDGNASGQEGGPGSDARKVRESGRKRVKRKQQTRKIETEPIELVEVVEEDPPELGGKQTR